MMKRFNYSHQKRNNTRFASLLCVIMYLALALPGRAQMTPPWVIPLQYQQIEPLSAELCKVKSNAQVGVIDLNGNMLVAIDADSITNFTNGYALILKKEDDRYQITSILDYTHKVVKISDSDGPFYAGTFPFFSDGKCVVQNKKGKYGFLDYTGKLAIPCKYLSARPFREGLASVCKSKGGLKGFFNTVIDMVGGESDNTGPSLYINESGQAIRLSSEIGTPDLASTFNEGTAFVMSEKGSFIINKNGQIVSVEQPRDRLSFDDYFILISSDEPHRVNIPYELVRNQDNYTDYQEGNLKGLKYNNLVILPAQFDEIEYLGNDLAIVKNKGKVGLISLSSSIPNCDVKVNDGVLSVSATLPGIFDGVSLTLARIIGNQKSNYMMAGDKSTRTLEIRLTTDESNVNETDVMYELSGNGVVLWRSTGLSNSDYDQNETTSSRRGHNTEKKSSKDNKSKTKGGIIASCPSTIKANAKNICSVPVTVTNKSNVALNVKISPSTGGSTNVVVPAGKSKVVTISISGVNKSKLCSFMVTSSAGT